MAVVPALHSGCFTIKIKPHILLCKPFTSTPPTRLKSTIISQNSSPQSSKPTITNDPIPDNSNPNSSSSSSTGQGFGSAQQQSKLNAGPSSSKKKGRRERGSIIRRSPVEKPAFLSDKKGVEQISDNDQSVGERAFLLAWLSLGGLIFVEGICLSASGFLPEEWDKFFVKFVYPSFTPTVFLFVACSVAYGVFKYFQNENVRNQK